jgi:hypothetical protein
MDSEPSTMPPQPETPQVPEMSLAGRLFNILATPGEVYDYVRTKAHAPANWLVPAILLLLVGWIGIAVVFSQPTIKQQLTEMTDKAIQQQAQKTNMPEQQLEKMRDVIIMSQKISFVALPVVQAFVFPFIWGLYLWVVGGLLMKGGFGYMKAVEVVGLSNVISVLEAVVKSLMIVAMGNLFASPSLALFIKDFDPQNPVHSLAGGVTIFSFWCLGVRSLGLARVGRFSFGKSALVVFGFWVLYTGFFIGLGFLGKALTSK